MTWKKNLQRRWKALLAAIVAVAVIALGIWAGTSNDAEELCLKATEQFESSEITLVEFYDACKDIIETLEPHTPVDGKLPVEAV